MTNCSKNIIDIFNGLWAASLFLSNFDAICNLFLNRHTEAWSLFVNFRAFFFPLKMLLSFFWLPLSAQPAFQLGHQIRIWMPHQCLWSTHNCIKLSLINKADSYVNTIYHWIYRVQKFRIKFIWLKFLSTIITIILWPSFEFGKTCFNISIMSKIKTSVSKRRL